MSFLFYYYNYTLRELKVPKKLKNIFNFFGKCRYDVILTLLSVEGLIGSLSLAFRTCRL